MACCIRASYGLRVCVCASVSVCIFTLLPYQLLFPQRGVAQGARGPRGLGVCAQTIIKDRDSGRLWENVFMFVCMGAPAGLSPGLGF